jgi:uncharacterized membrane protein
MTEEVQPDLVERGHNDVVRAAGTMVGLSIGITIAYVLRVGTDSLPIQSLRFVLTILLVWLLYRGHAWARWLMLALAGVAVFIGMGVTQTLFSRGETAEGLVMALLTVGYFIVARTLLWSPGIGPFQAAQRAARASAR